MRKHFLILMLMALLPMAGWAADGDIDEPVGQLGLTYSTLPQNLLAAGHEGGVEGLNYELRYAVVTSETATPEWADFSTDAPQGTDAGDYFVYFASYNTVTGAHSAIGPKISVKIDKCELTAKVKTDADAPAYFSKSFLGADPVKPVKADVAITGMPLGVAASELVDVADEINFSYIGVNANADKTGVLFTLTSGYAIDFTGITLKSTMTANYKLTIAPRVMRIKQIPLALADYTTAAAPTAGKFTVTRNTSYDPANKPVYTGLAQNASYTVKYYYGTTPTAYEMQATDVVIKYKNATETYDNAIDALDYTPVVSFQENGNFAPADVALESADATNYGIGKKNLFVLLNTNSKVYDQKAFLAGGSTESAATFNYSALVGKDAGKVVTWASASNADNVEANSEVLDYLKPAADTYSMIAKQAAAEAARINYPAINYTAEEAAAYNETLGGALHAGVALTADEALDYNSEIHPTPEKVTGSILTAAEANAYNATLAGAKSTASVKIDATTAPLNKNYIVKPVAANWTITKKAITVTAEPEYTAPATSITYGDPIPTINIVVEDHTDAVVADEIDGIKAAFKYTLPNPLAVGANAITVSQMTTVAELKAAYIKANAADPAHPTDAENTAATTFANNTIALMKNYNPVVTAGTLNVLGVGLTIVPNVAAQTEYDTEVAVSYVAFNSKTLASVTLTKTPTYLYRKSTEAASAATTTKPTAIGNYIVSIYPDETLCPTTGGLDKTNITYEETPFEITKKVLDFTISDVTLHTGDTKTTLNKYGEINLKAGYTLKSGEKIKAVFNFVAVTGLTVGDEAHDFVISGDAGNYNGAIVASLPEGVENNDNYTLKAGVTGKLIIADGRNLFVDGTKDNINDLIEDAAIACANAPALAPITYNVTFSDRTLTANEWNVMVLPFAITPLEFCNAKCTVAAGPDAGDYVNDYAIFNVLKSANKEANTMKFGITLNEIPANTPFLVKPTKDIKFMRTYVENPTTTHKYYLTFTGRTIEYAAVPKVTVDEVDFIGTFKNGLTVEGGESIMFMGIGTDGHYTFVTAMDGGQPYDITVNSTRAYLDFNASGMTRPTILVEEADGSTTAITNISADGVAMNAEGWYTLNGVKLQSMPTQKGVYINNGKKVVIK